MVLLFLLSFPSVQNFCFVTAFKKFIENIVKTDYITIYTNNKSISNYQYQDTKELKY